MDMTVDGAAMARIDADAGAARLARRGEYLTFRLGQEEYGIEILRVQEIRSYVPPTRIAKAPPCIKGVINLRGVIVPIVDLRLKLGCEPVVYDQFTVVIVLNLRERVIGVVVDSVSDVLQLGAEHIKPAPPLSTAIGSGFITGIGSIEQSEGGAARDRMLILIDIEGLMGAADMGLIQSLG